MTLIYSCNILESTKGSNLPAFPPIQESTYHSLLGKLQFLDSLNFMNESLGKLWITWQQKVINIFITSRDISLIQKKGNYCWEKESIPMNGWIMQIKWNTLLYLRKKSLIASCHSPVSQMMTTHMQRMYRNIPHANHERLPWSLPETDVLLLADVFENFRKKCLEYYALDPAHHYTAPGLSWDAALKMTKVNLELLDDIEMHLMVEKGNNNFSTVASIIISAYTLSHTQNVLFQFQV